MKKVLYFILILLFICSASLYFCNNTIKNKSIGKIYSDTSMVPYNKVGLLLGTSKYLSNGTVNLYYRYRIDAAVSLLQSKKIKYIIVSGDNSRESYDEPTQMREDLMSAGIDSTLIYLDYAGFRTFDSMVRAKEIFGQDSLTVISQQFHNERAIFIGNMEKMNVIGFNAQDINIKNGFKTQLREKFARVKVYIDYLMGKKPKFLGQKINIPN